MLEVNLPQKYLFPGPTETVIIVIYATNTGSASYLDYMPFTGENGVPLNLRCTAGIMWLSNLGADMNFKFDIMGVGG